MDLIQDPKTKRWRAREPFKRYIFIDFEWNVDCFEFRYWQTALWEEMFDAF